MKRILAVMAIALLAVGCGAKTDKAQSGAPLNMSVLFAPDPLRQGPETITVTLTDASGAPVKGADVKIAGNMPAMSMSGPMVSGADNGDGTYTAHMKLTFGTQWKFTIVAAANGAKASTEVTKDVP